MKKIILIVVVLAAIVWAVVYFMGSGTPKAVPTTVAQDTQMDSAAAINSSVDEITVDDPSVKLKDLDGDINTL